MTEINLVIPKDRLGALIGQEGQVKNQIEKLLNINLLIDSYTGSVKVKENTEENPLNILKAKDVILAISHGFSPEKSKSNSLKYLLNTAEKPIPENSLFQSVSLSYSSALYPFLFWKISPVIYFFILSLLFGFIIKPFMKVNI